jgi:hypothetical protein
MYTADEDLIVAHLDHEDKCHKNIHLEHNMDQLLLAANPVIYLPTKSIYTTLQTNSHEGTQGSCICLPGPKSQNLHHHHHHHLKPSPIPPLIPKSGANPHHLRS